MLKMSFYDGTLDRNKLMQAVRETTKPILFTYGLIFRKPTTYRKPITVSEAMEIIRKEGFLDADEEPDCIHLNAFSETDMW